MDANYAGDWDEQQQALNRVSWWREQMTANPALIAAAQETLEQQWASADAEQLAVLEYFRFRAVENGWTVGDTNSYIVRNVQDIINSFDTMFDGGGAFNEDQFNNVYVNNTDTTKNFANIDASPRLSLNQFKDIFIRDNGLVEAEVLRCPF